MNEATVALIAIIVSTAVSYFISNRDLSDSLDTKSGWREKLFAVASKYELTLDDAQTVRTALRIFPNFEKVERHSFTWFSNIMIVHLDKYILSRDKLEVVTVEDDKSSTTNGQIKVGGLQLFEKSEEIIQKSKKLNTMNSQFVRLFAMFLLKYHFDYRSAMGAKDYLSWFNKENKNKRYSRLIEEAYSNYKKLLNKWGGPMENSTQQQTTDTKENGSEQSQNSEANGAIVAGWLVFCSTLFTLLMILGLFFTNSNGKLSSNVQFIDLRLRDLFNPVNLPNLPNLLNLLLVPTILLILAIVISILSGMVVNRSNDYNSVHTTEQDNLKEIWESIYNQ
ncbi:hypothetical protein HPA16_05125 [Streptococcus suis]|nr:hypothetical protein [Streptococcus suis]